MILARIESVQVGRPQRYAAEGDAVKPWTSAIRKQPVQGSVAVGRTNLAGDEQADLKHHGGPDKAILAYAAQHFDAWNREFPDHAFAAGSFGENLTLAGCSEADCCIGDIVRIGDCQLQISQPRQPCWKLSRLRGLPNLALRVQQTGRTGWYLRVLQEGTIEAGLPVELLERPFPEFTVAWASTVMYSKPRVPENDRRLAACEALCASWKSTLNNRAHADYQSTEQQRLYGRSSEID